MDVGGRLWMLALIASLVLSAGCVPRARLDEAMDAARVVSLERDEARQALDDLGIELERTENRLATERRRAEAQQQLIAQLQEREQALGQQLAALTGLVSELGERNARERDRKAELERLLDELRGSAEATEREAARSLQRIAALEQEAAALEQEAAALAEEMVRLSEEKAQLARRTSEYDALVAGLQAEIDAGQISITELSGKLTVEMSNAILFDTGSTQIKPDGVAALTKVAGVLANVRDRAITVEGHTDDVAVRPGASFKDNWGLSALRASTVVGLLVSQGVDPLNIAATGYGEHRPAADNATDEGRARNRRTEIVLVPRLDAAGTLDDGLHDP